MPIGGARRHAVKLWRPAAVVAALVEGNSIRATARMTNVSKPTILKLLADLGAICAAYQDEMIRNVKAARVQVDEIWQFVYAKAKHVPAEMRGQFGVRDVWTWCAIDADSKLMISWRIGPRDAATAHELMQDLAGRVRGHIQLTTDGNRLYLNAVEDAFAANVDYAMLQKVYGVDPTEERRYSPPVALGTFTDTTISFVPTGRCASRRPGKRA